MMIREPVQLQITVMLGQIIFLAYDDKLNCLQRIKINPLKTMQNLSLYPLSHYDVSFMYFVLLIDSHRTYNQIIQTIDLL